MMDDQLLLTPATVETEQPDRTGLPLPTRTFGEIVLWRGATPCCIDPRLLDAYILCLPAQDLGWQNASELSSCPANGAVLIDPLASADVADLVYGQDMVLLLPRRLATSWSHERAGISVLGPVPGLAAVTCLVRGLLERNLSLSPAQMSLLGRAVLECLTAVLGAGPEGRTSVAERRGASLLERLADHIDTHLADQLDVSALCEALACSRSVLYRATGPVGGVAVFITQRRLSALYKRLIDPAEHRTVAALARNCGFRDSSGFSRTFKRHFGRTATELRRSRLSLRSKGA